MALRVFGYSLKHKKAMALAIGAVVLSALCAGSSMAMPVPDNQKAVLEIRGSGVSPSSRIVLMMSEKNSIVVESDKNGQFAFEKLNYYSFVPLKFRLEIPEGNMGKVSVGKTSLDFNYNPQGAMVILSGKMSPAGSVAVNVDGVMSDSRITGAEGTFEIQLRTPMGVADGTSQILANIINVGEICCPKMLVPAAPIQLSVSSVAINSQPPMPIAPSVPSRAPAVKKAPAPSYIVPSKPDEETVPKKEEAPAKKKIPYLVTGSYTDEITIKGEDFSAAISFPPGLYENTYVGGYKKLADQVRDAIITHALMIGAFLDGRSTLASLSVLQKLNANAMKDYEVSDTICKYGTLSRAVVGSEALAEANKSAFSKIILDRNTQSNETLYSEATQGMVYRMNNFKGKYCEEVDAGSGLEGYCSATVGTPDKYYNRDVDFTRVFDVPLTLDVNYTDNTLTPDEEKVIALFENLALQDPELDSSGQKLMRPDKNEDTQNLRQNTAVRQLVGNTFANLVGMKAKGTTTSATYMQSVLTKLGLSAADAKKLIGDNPSYFAQMEILTKKLYQDPAFYANLYDTPANVARQRVAVKAISLMQDRDFFESLRRREMLLSELLELKLRKKSQEENQAGIASD